MPEGVERDALFLRLVLDARCVGCLRESTSGEPVASLRLAVLAEQERLRRLVLVRIVTREQGAPQATWEARAFSRVTTASRSRALPTRSPRTLSGRRRV